MLWALSSNLCRGENKTFEDIPFDEIVELQMDGSTFVLSGRFAAGKGMVEAHIKHEGERSNEIAALQWIFLS
jgi:hypothetical protein